MPDATGKRWYLVQCKPRQDSRALEHLERQGYRCLLPMHQDERLYKGQLQPFVTPLFPGYLFIHLDKVGDSWLPIRSTRGVTTIVSFGGHPTPVPQAVIDHLLTIGTLPSPALLSGDRITINIPGLEQLETIYLEKDGENRVLLLLTILQRQVIIKAPIKNLKKHTLGPRKSDD
ncbi:MULTISPECIES: transcription/translation regulatory transformer protein RfaH [unclassified Pseudomonas]|uniref:transcription/translation regulatory transformer protein RfaH n=1 Tax=unclassified Pseudomonas TaxID=196821 RepID=UPI000A04B711|nr:MULTISPECIES: transcription/translation regulatory transformer protein RfaH [unclassified Pseudomonas]MBB1606426.1 hypothetical protein [Pseudomonas sp. UMC76]MBB1640800.1 hypothetical protein [Pseudomonas sp. UME83]NTX91114.1 transcription/translation regulatory transformer protein RfaH [Pseudomonas sp. UMA643]NTY18576.1 transcription/translation regulatory transformer protein RfaH [Pseudomonas sp. UMC3103]NTY23600.1 transcription/translation regulatory transformer protein RfaH [Pseudomona